MCSARRWAEMARYRFHSAERSKFRDEDGDELPDLAAAKALALEVLTKTLPGKADDFWEHKTFSVHVKDGEGRLVVTVTPSQRSTLCHGRTCHRKADQSGL